jgi:methionyl-tRNA formyltransferase
MKLLIFSSSDFSVYSLGLIEFSLRDGHEVAGVVIRRTFQIRRIREELRHGLTYFFSKVCKKIFSYSNNFSENKSGWCKLLEENDIRIKRVSSYCNEKGIKYIKVNEFNNKATIEFIENVNADVALFGGGGIIRQDILNKIDIINCHMGILPKYRGNYPWIWALLNGDINDIGLTVHLMVTELDLGPILTKYYLPPLSYHNISKLVNLLEFNMITQILSGLSKYQDHLRMGQLPSTNIPKEGRLYFKPHASLFYLANEIAKKNL